MYIVISTFLDYSNGNPNDRPDPVAGAVWGPFDTREEARTAIEEMDFPHPEHVYIRPLHAPVK